MINYELSYLLWICYFFFFLFSVSIFRLPIFLLILSPSTSLPPPRICPIVVPYSTILTTHHSDTEVESGYMNISQNTRKRGAPNHKIIFVFPSAQMTDRFIINLQREIT